MNKKDENLVVKAAMSVLGRRKTPRKAMASSKNFAKARAALAAKHASVK